MDTPLIKRVPNSQRSNFATAWGRLLDAAVSSKQEAAWSEFFLFPKCILWAPSRGGKRIAKKGNMADLVRARISKWTAGEKDGLWKDAVERSKREPPDPAARPRKPQSEKERSDKEREARVIAALL